MTEYIIECDYDVDDGIIAGEVREEVVRCGDCMHASYYHPLDWRTGKPSETLEEWYCNWHANAEGASDIEPDGFCAWGERKKGGDAL